MRSYKERFLCSIRNGGYRDLLPLKKYPRKLVGGFMPQRHRGMSEKARTVTPLSLRVVPPH